MDRRGTSAFLIPLLAALALFFPVAMQEPASKPPTESQRNKLPSKTAHSEMPSGPNSEPTAGKLLVRDFLGISPREDRSWPTHDRRSKNVIGFLIATLPDPVASGLPYEFDRFVGSIQAALQAKGYVLYQFKLPWQDCLPSASQTGGDTAQSGQAAEDLCKEKRPYEVKPGLLLFSNHNATPNLKQEIDGREDAHLLLVYLIGETPTGGIHKAALKAALQEIHWFCARGSERNDPLPLAGQQSCNRIAILGPTFSGSAQSLDFVMSSWLDSVGRTSDVSFRVISGSATAIDPKKDFQDAGQFVDFHATVVPDSVASCRFWDYLQELEPDDSKRRVALLMEGNTSYGQAGKGRECSNKTELTAIPFPLHISQLRAASTSAKSSQDDTTPSIRNSYKSLPLTESLEEVNQRSDSIPSLSQLEPPTSEQVLANVLSTISREGYRYVGILATDTRDAIFLANEIHEHCPTTVVFTYNPDLLFLNSQQSPALRGMLMISSYPLYNANLLWSPTHPQRIRLQFPDQAAEGVYNATLALIGHDENMIEYGLPFQGSPFGLPIRSPTGPPVWVSVVGRDRLWPLIVVVPNPKKDQHQFKEYEEYAAYTYGLSAPLAGSDPNDLRKFRDLWFHDLYPQGIVILMTLVTFVGVIFAIAILNHDVREQIVASDSWRAKLRQRLPTIHIAKDKPGRIFLLAACASLLIFQFLTLTLILLPAVSGLLEWTLTRVLYILLCFSGLVFLSAAVARLILDLLGGGQSDSETSSETSMEGSPWNQPLWPLWFPVALGFASILGLALSLAVGWVLLAVHKESHVQAFFFALRSLDLRSGVTLLLPCFFIALTYFLWGITSFVRVRFLQGLKTPQGFLSSADSSSDALRSLERGVCRVLVTPALSLRFALIIALLNVSAGGYLFFSRVVHSFEGPLFYCFLGITFIFVYLALWLESLRFWWVWRELRHLLHHLSLHPMRGAYKRFRNSFPTISKIDLAETPAPLAALTHSVDLARTLLQRAADSVKMQDATEGEFRLQAAKEEKRFSADIRWSAPKTETLSKPTSSEGSEPFEREKDALKSFGSEGLTRSLAEARAALMAACHADASGCSQEALAQQQKSQEALANMSGQVSRIVEVAWWAEMHSAVEGSQESSPSKLQPVFWLAEDFLVSRVVHFLGYVLPQMEKLIYSSVAGLLLMLFAANSYPFQPHNLLLLFNWAVILTFAGLAMFVFIQMNRDTVLSSLNGTEPGQINWDREFVFRILIYVIFPILALLGAQFPQTIGQILSHLIPGESTHP